MTNEQDLIPQAPQTPAPVSTSMTLREYIDTYGDKIGVPKPLRDSIFQNETGFEHYDGSGRVKTSPKGARGVGQLMPATAKGLSVDPDDPIQNAYGSLRLQKQLYDKYLKTQGDPHQAAILAAAAYNSGEGNVDKYNGIPPFAETQGYVKKVADHLRKNPIQTVAAAQTEALPDESLPTDESQDFSGPIADAKTHAAARALERITAQHKQEVRRRQRQAQVAQAQGVMSGITAGVEGESTLMPEMGRAPSMSDVTAKAKTTVKRQGDTRTSEQVSDAHLMEQATKNVTGFTLDATANVKSLYRAATKGLEGGFESDVQEEFQRLKEQQASANTPEMIAERKDWGTQPAGLRAVLQPAARTGAGLVKMIAGVSSLAGVAPNEVSDYLNHRAQVLEESTTNAPLTPEGKEIIRGLPEKAVSAVVELGLSVAEIVALKKATGLSLGRLMAIETALKTNDLPVTERAPKIAEAYGMGKVLDVELSRPASAAIFGGPTALRSGYNVAQGRMSVADALLQTGVQAGAGAILGGGGVREITRGALEYTAQSPFTPEPVKDVVANVMQYGKGLVKSEDGRNLSIYADPESGKIFGNELTDEQAKSYDPSIVTGEKRPVRNAKTVSGDEYDQLARALSIETKTPAKQIGEGPEVEVPLEKNITPENASRLSTVRVSENPESVASKDRAIAAQGQTPGSAEVLSRSEGPATSVRPSDAEQVAAQPQPLKTPLVTEQATSTAQVPTPETPASPGILTPVEAATSAAKVEPQLAEAAPKDTAPSPRSMDEIWKAGVTTVSTPTESAPVEPSSIPEGMKERSLPKTFKAAEMESGPTKTYEPQTVEEGVSAAKALVDEKGVDGAMEFVRTGDGIEWASTGYEASARLRTQEAELRKSGDAKGADAVQEKRLKFLDDFALGAVERGRSIVGIKAIEEFAPDRAVYLLNKASQKKRGRGVSADEEARMASLGEELKRERDRSKGLETALAEATVKRQKQSTSTAKKATYQSQLDKQGEIAKAQLAAKLGNLSFGSLTVPRGQSGKVQIGIPALPGDAELLAQYAASRLNALNTVADLNTEMVKEFGKEVEPHLPIIRQRAYQIRHEARLAELETKDTGAKRRRTILNEIQIEINESRKVVQEHARESERANKEAKVQSKKEETEQAREGAKEARQKERAGREAIAKEARRRLSDAKREYQEAAKAETKGYRETIKSEREAARVAKLWDTPIRNAANEARARLANADPKTLETMDDLVSVAAEKLLPKTIGGAVRKGTISPVQVYSELRSEFPSLITKKNKGEIYKRAFLRIDDMTEAAREAARLRSASAESQKIWEEQGMDIDAQGILIQKAEATRRQNEVRKKMVDEFNRVSQSRVGKVVREIENIPRALQTTLNMHQGRQGLYMILTHPIAVTAKVGIPATLKGYSALTRSQYLERVRELKAHPYYGLGEKAGLNLAELPGTDEDAHLAVEEDELQSTVAMNLPHVRISNQGFALGMNSERVAAFGLYAAIGESEGYTWENNPKFFKEMAEIANDATGRGTMPKAIQGMAKLTNHVFYATRLNVSRVKILNDLFNPWKYYNYDPVTRRIMVSEAIKIIMALAAIYTAARLLGLHTEFGDADDPDSGKIVWGHTHYDLTGGMGTNIRFAYRFARGVANELVGNKVKENEKSLALGERFVRQKLAPWPTAAIDYVTGKNAVGEPANLSVDVHAPLKTIKENIAARMLVPIVAADFATGFEDGGWLGAAKETPVLAGFGAQTYEPKKQKPDALIPKEAKVPQNIRDRVDKEFKRLEIKTGTVQGSVDVMTELEQKEAVRGIMESDKVDRKTATETLREKDALPQERLDRFNQSYQENLYRLANQLITNDQFYSRLKDYEKEDRLDRVKTIAHTIARREIKTELKGK